MSSFRHLPAKRVSAVIHQLVNIRHRADPKETPLENDRPFPFVTLFMRSGARFSGTPLDVHYEREDTVLLLHLVESGERFSNELVYLSLDDVEAITVHQASEHAAHLSFGEVPGEDGNGQGYSKSDLQRHISQLDTLLSEQVGLNLTGQLDWETLHDEPMSLSVMAIRAERLFSALRRIANVPAGRKMIEDHVNAISIAQSTESRAMLDGSVLLVELGDDADQETLHDTILAALPPLH